MNIKKLSVTKILFVLSVILAMCFAMQVLGHKLLFPFPTEIKFDMPICNCITDSGEMLVTDSENTRLIFCDKNGKACRIENLDETSPISKVLQIIKDDNYFYVRGVKYKRNTSFVQSEKVLRYDFSGKNRSLLYENIREWLQRYSCLYDISIYGDRLYYVTGSPVKGQLGYTVAVSFVDTDPETNDTPQSVFQSTIANAYTSHYLAHEKKLYTNDFLGYLYLESENSCTQVDLKGKAARIFLPEHDGSIIYSNSTNWNLYRGQTIIAENVAVSCLSSSEKYVLFNNEFAGTLMRYNKLTGDTESLNSVKFSAPFWGLTLLRFLSVIYILALLFVLIVKFLISLFKHKEYILLRRIGVIVFGVFILILISWFYTNHIYQMQLNEIKKEVLVHSNFFSNTVKADSFSKNAKLLSRLQNQVNEADFKAFTEELSEWVKYYGSYVAAAEAKGSYPHVLLYTRMKDRLLLLYDSFYGEQFGESFDLDSAVTTVMKNIDKTTVSFIEATEALCSVVPVKDDSGEIVGLVEVNEDFSVFKKRMTSDILKLTMELLTIFVVIYLVLTEGKSLLLGLRERARRLLEKNPVAELATMRSLSFLFYLLTSFDGVILVLITREMLLSGGYPPNAITWLMALPAMAYAIGNIIGTLLYSFFVRYIPIKKLAIGSITLMAVCCVLMIPVIMKNLFFVFVALKFFSGVYENLSFGMLLSMPFRTENEDDRYHALKDRVTGEVSSSILGAMIGGFISQEFGNISLYAVNTIAFVPLIVLMLVVIPKNCFYVNRAQSKKNRGSLKNFGKFLISIPVLSFLIFLTVPLITLGGYKSYLFPIYAAAMEMPKLYITNFYVFARVVMLLLDKPIAKVTRHIEYWKLSIIGMFIMGMAYLGFALNATIVWAVIMLLIDAILTKIVLSAREMLWPRQAKVFGLNIVETSNYMSLFERIVFSIKEMILSVFLLLGNQEACIAVGVFCIVFTLLFALTTYRSALAKGQ
ncbi:MAG: MFS transporter [Synergistaceae bacterium]|nr:MFS transporter [Synergistaceae bacterium]